MKHPDKWKFWVLIAFICKGLIFLFLLNRHPVSSIPGFWGETGGDTDSYLSPIDNLLAHGSYNSFRMPGYGAIYLPFAFIFSKQVACNILIILQFLLSALAVYPLAMIAKYVFKSAGMFHLTFWLYAISIYPNLGDAALLTESFTTSFLILSVYFYIKAIQNEDSRTFNLFLSGLLITEVIFLRPVFFPVWLLLLGILFIFIKRQQLKTKIWLNLIILAAPFLLMDGLWTMRNYIAQKKIIPLTSSVFTPVFNLSYVSPLVQLVTSWGGSNIWWDDKSELRWFGLKAKISNPDSISDANIKIPDYIYTSKFNHDSLILLKNEITILNHTTDTNTWKKLTAVIQAQCNVYSQSIKTEKPFLYYFKARFIILQKFIVNPGGYALFNSPFNQLNFIKRFFKIFYALFYYAIILVGFTGIATLIRQFFKPPLLILLLASIVIYTIIIHVFWFRFSENRYFIPAYPYLLVCAAYATNWLWTRKMQSKKTPT